MPNDRPARRRTTHRGEVLRTERLTPHMVRVVLGGDGLAQFSTDGLTDHYVKLSFPSPLAPDVDLSDVSALRDTLPREQWPVSRTYTVRRWDAERRELWLDFVVHGDEGIAGPWADTVTPGAQLFFNGPGGAYAPDAAADWHLLAGDESALPAIAAALEAMPREARGVAFLEVSGPGEEQPLDAPSGVEVVWLHRAGRQVGELLTEHMTGLAFAGGEPQVFVHGEATFVKALRRHLRVERGLGRERLSVSGYWRLGVDEDGWQSSKRDWNQAAEQEEEAALASR